MEPPSPGPANEDRGGGAPAVEAPAAAEVKLVGYLEKRSKMIGWKRFWFVLDGALLTYYRTKADYDSAVAPCLGSINLGLASSVRPLQAAQRGGRGFPLQITTRSQIYYLRASDKSVLEKWLIALQETASAPPEISSPTWADPGVQFYRYSFATGSQWSLAVSIDDVSGSLRDLPRNFYLKPPGGGLLAPPATQMSKSQSLACLSVPPATMPSRSSSPSPKLHLNASKAPSGLRPGSLTSSPAPPAKPIRQATSMLMLPSSEAEAALRRELTTALFKRSASSLSKDRDENDRGGQGTQGSPSGAAAVYDEIIDFEAVRSSTVSGDSESVSDVSSPPSSPAAAPTLKPDFQPNHRPHRPTTNPWELRHAEVATSRVIYHVEEEEPPSPRNGGGVAGGRKKKGIGGFFQKIFKKDKDKAGRDGGNRSRSGSTSSSASASGVRSRSRSGSTRSTSGSRQQEPVISGPVDLRATAGKAAPPTTLSFAPAPATPQTLAMTAKGVEPPRSPQLESVMAELKSRVGQINANAKEKSRKSPASPPATPAAPAPVPTPLPDIYQNNLGKFNRLSAHLNPTFVAALNKSGGGPAAPTTAGGANANGHAISSASAVPRSNSLSARYGQTAREEPPLLPPKKRRGEPATGTGPPAPAYDVPQNNQPVTTTPDADAPSGLVNLSSFYNACNGDGNAVRLRDLTKKNSAPDVTFPPAPAEPKGSGGAHAEAESELPILLQLNIVPPPLITAELDCPCRTWPALEKDDGPPPPLPLAPAPVQAPPQVIDMDEEVLAPEGASSGKASPTAKSIDIDNLDALSDISAGGAEASAAIYANLPPLKYATISTLVTELETVEENEDELYEYEQFVVEGLHAVAVERTKGSTNEGAGRRREAALPLLDVDDDVFLPAKLPDSSSPSPRAASVRHSGIDALQRYLFQDPAAAGSGKGGSGGAINRLGHSAAVNQLHALLHQSEKE